MLPYWPQFCNIFLVSSPPAWQGPRADWWRRGRPRRVAVTWRALGLTGPLRIRLSLCATCRTHAHLSVPHPHVTRTAPPTQRSAAHTRWISQAVSLCNPPASTRHLSAARSRQSDCVSRYLRLLRRNRLGAHGHSAFGVACTYGRRPVYLRETPPCTYGRRPRVPTGDAPCTYGRRPVYLRETPRVPTGDALCTYGRRPVYLRETKYDLTFCS